MPGAGVAHYIKQYIPFKNAQAYMIRKLYIGADPYEMLRKVDKTVCW